MEEGLELRTALLTHQDQRLCVNSCWAGFWWIFLGGKVGCFGWSIIGFFAGKDVVTVVRLGQAQYIATH